MNIEARTGGAGTPWTVSALNDAVRALLEEGFRTVWVVAEVTSLARPASGHLYFTLRDADAQLRAAFFRQRQRGSVRTLAEGDQVLVRGRLSLYAPRGDYQLIVEHLEPAGEGALRQAFEQLKRKLAAEGLFATERKRPLPPLPRTVGVVTSSTGAALRDVLKVMRRRMPGIAVMLYPSLVQGTSAPGALRRAVERAGQHGRCDVLLVVRGGGSLEDLAAFNDEALARAIAACPVPVVTGIGHETDLSIADLVADRAAPTPSAAAEIVTPDGAALRRSTQSVAVRLARALRRTLESAAQRLDYLARRLDTASPAARLERQHTQLVALRRRLRISMQAACGHQAARHAAVRYRLRLQHPARRIAAQRTVAAALVTRLRTVHRHTLDVRRMKLESLAQQLNAVSPLGTLARGYAIVTNADGAPLTSVQGVAPGAEARARLADGTLVTEVRAVEVSAD